MKRLAVALATLGLSTLTINAATLPGLDSTLVTVPQLPGGFSLGVTPYFLKPDTTNGDHAFVVLTEGIFNTNTFFDPGYNWSFAVNANYIFPTTANDISVNYFHYGTTGDETTEESGRLDLSITNLPLLIDDITTQIDYHMNQVDVTAGQFISIGHRVSLHPNVGLRYADIERKIDSTASGSTASLNVNAIDYINEDSDFSGIGPIAGLDATYFIGNGAGIVAHFNGALMAGSSTAKTHIFQGGVPQFIIQDETESRSRLVPTYDAKLGANYTYLFQGTVNTSLTLEAGYQISEYFNAIDRLTLASGNITKRTTADLGIDGIYVNLTATL